jgi:hypothetical protein
MAGGIKKTVILTVDSDLYSELKIIANTEHKTVEVMLEDWVKHLVKTRGSTQMIRADDLQSAKEQLRGAAKQMGLRTNVPNPHEDPTQKTRFIKGGAAVSLGEEKAEETIVFFCRFCFQKCRISKHFVGQEVECPRCRNPLEVPHKSSSSGN